MFRGWRDKKENMSWTQERVVNKVTGKSRE